MLTLAVAVATAIPLLSLFAIYRLDRYGTRAFRLVLMCAAWGVIVTQVALVANTAVLDSGLVSGPTIGRVVAPVVEEIAKGLIIGYLILRPRFSYFVDGAIYGFAVGIGFAVAENYHYLGNHQQTALTLAIGRVVSTNLMHASTTALTGIALGLARFEPTARRRVAIALAGLGLAMLMHIAFNTLVTRFSGSIAMLYALAAGYGLSGALAVAVAIRLGLRKAEGWIRPTLAASHRVAEGEIAAVEALDHESTVLAPIETRFGERMAHDVHALLQLEARLGILFETREHLPDGAARREVDEELARDYAELDRRRRSIGVFCMLHVRSIAPDRSGPIWRALDLGLHPAPAAAPATAGGRASGAVEAPRIDMWKSLDKRTAPRWARVGRWVGRRGRKPAQPERTVRGTTSTMRVGLALLYAGATAILWLGPHMAYLPAWEALSEPTLARIAAQWLLTLGLLAALAPHRPIPRRRPARRDLWTRASRRLEARAHAGSLRFRLTDKAEHLVLLVILVVSSTLLWTSDWWWPAPWWATYPERIAIQALVQLMLGLTAAAALGHIRRAPWLATAIAIGAAITELVWR